jgi:hypothetical protein
MSLLEYDSGVKKYEILIRDDVLTVGDLIRIGVYADQIIEYVGGNPEKSSLGVREFVRKIAKAFIVVKRGLFVDLLSSDTMNKVIIENLLRLPLSLVEQIVKNYNENAEKPIVSDSDDAKKK